MLPIQLSRADNSRENTFVKTTDINTFKTIPARENKQGRKQNNEN